MGCVRLSGLQGASGGELAGDLGSGQVLVAVQVTARPRRRRVLLQSAYSRRPQLDFTDQDLLFYILPVLSR